jgi:WD40 repeat protein
MKTRTHLLVLLFGILSVAFHVPLHAQDKSTEREFIYGGLAWSPDGSMIAVGTSGGIWLHSADDLSIIRQFAKLRFVTTLDWSPDGQKLASGEDDIHIWDVNTGRVLHTLAVANNYGASSVRWSPNGDLLAAGCGDDTIRVWNTETREEIFRVETDAQITIRYSVTWSPNGQRISAKRQWDMAIWDVFSGEVVLSWPYNLEVSTTEWSPDGELIASGDSENIKLWDPVTGELLYTFDAEGDHAGWVNTLDWSPDSRLLANHIRRSSDADAVEVWDVETGEKLVEISGIYMDGDGFYNNALAWSPDDSRLASTSDDGKVYIWDTETYETLAVYEGYSPIWS